MPPKKPARWKLQRHPWDHWFSLRSFSLRRGHEFHGMTHAMAGQVRNAAALRGIRVHVEILENVVKVRVVP